MISEVKKARAEEFSKWRYSVVDLLNSLKEMALNKGKSSSIPMYVTDDLQSRTDGKAVYVSLAEFFLDPKYNEDFWLLMMKAGVLHECQHVNSTDLPSSIKAADEFAKWFKNTYQINEQLGSNLAFQFFNIVEDGRIENIIVTNYPGYTLMFAIKNGEYRANNAIYKKAETPKDEFNDFMAEVFSYAKCGGHAFGIDKYHGTEMEKQFMNIRDDIDRAVAGYSCADMLHHTVKALKKAAPYIAKLIKEDSDLYDALEQALSQMSGSDNEIDFNTQGAPGQGGLRISQRSVPDESSENESESSSGGDSQNSQDGSSNNSQSGSKNDSGESGDNSDGKSDDNSDGKSDGKSGSGTEKSEDEKSNDSGSSSAGDSSQNESGESGNTNSQNGSSNNSQNGSDGNLNKENDSRDNSPNGENSTSNKNNSTGDGDDLDSPRSMIDEVPAGTDMTGDFSNMELQQRGYTEEELREAVEYTRAEVEKSMKNSIDVDRKATRVNRTTSKKLSSLYNQGILEEVVPCGKKPLPVELKKQADRLKMELASILKIKFHDRYHQRNGQLDNNCLWKIPCEENNLFMVRDKKKKSSVAVYLLIDNSGSMAQLSKSVMARRAAAVMEEAFSDFAACKIVLFASCSTVQHWIVKEFNKKERYNSSFNSLNRITPTGGNKDGYSIRVATSELKKRNEKKKFLIVLSDGMPSDYPGGQQAGMNDVKDAVDEARGNGVEVISIPFGSSDFVDKTKEDFKYMYKTNIVSANPRNIGEVMGKLFKKILT